MSTDSLEESNLKPKKAHRQETHTEAEQSNNIELIVGSCDVNECDAQCLVAHEGKQEAVARMRRLRALCSARYYDRRKRVLAIRSFPDDSTSHSGSLVLMLSRRGGCGALGLL